MISSEAAAQALERGITELTNRDSDLARIVSEYGSPPLWSRRPGFSALLRTILEQQVSLASAKAVYDRLYRAIDPLTPRRFLSLTDEELRAMGFSRQKARYGRETARAVIAKKPDLRRLGELPDAAVRKELMQLIGVGSWTADIYMLTALGRVDIWPRGDLALEVALQKLKGLPERPTPVEAQALTLSWRPWRSVGARLLWHYYLSAIRPAASPVTD